MQNSTKSLAVLVGAVLAGTPLWGLTQFTLKSDVDGKTFDWRSGANYVGDPAVGPAAGDAVAVPADCVAIVDDDSIGFVSTLRRLGTTKNRASVIRFNLTTNAVLNAAINQQSTALANGTVEKYGAGTLTFAATGSDYGGKNDYYNSYSIYEGALRIGSSLVDTTGQNVQDLYVGKDGTLLCTSGHSITANTLTGEGVVTNDSTSGAMTITVGNNAKYKSSTPLVFSGKIGGAIKLTVQVRTHLTGVENTFSGLTLSAYSSQTVVPDMEVGGVVGVQELGMKDLPSSIGLGGFTVGKAGGRLLYLGSGETTDKTFDISAASYPFVFDAGATGGVTFAGPWGLSANDSTRHIILTGTNTEACVLDNKFTAYGSIPAYVTKRGSGTWRFNHHDERNLVGAMAVEEGVVEYASMAPRGTVCSLGKSSELYEPTIVLKTDARPVDYAFLLGGDDTCGAMDYIGSKDVWWNGRPVEIKTAGGFSNSGTGTIKCREIGVGGDAGAKRLVLGGSNGGENMIADLRDDESRPLSVEKTGAGSWTLAGDTRFSGSLTVSGGTLNVRAPAAAGTPYSYFRLTIRENAYNCPRYAFKKTFSDGEKKHIQLQEFALYDAEGVRQNVFMPPVTETSFSTLPPGQAAYDWEMSYSIGATGRYLCRLFDDQTYNATYEIPYGGWDVALPKLPKADDPSSHFSIVIRLSETANVVSSYDICCYLGLAHADNPGRAITSYKLEGGTDGIRWELIDDVAEAVPPQSSAQWYFDKENFATGKTRTGFTFGREGRVTNTVAAVSRVSEIKVAGGDLNVVGGTVSLKEGVRLTLDTAKGGALRGIALPETGTLSVTGAERGKVAALPADLSGVQGLENVKDWNLLVNGEAKQGWSVGVRDGHLTLLPPGLSLIIR